MRNFYNRNAKPVKKFTRVNFQIKSPTVRVVKEGQQLGVFNVDVARKMAYDLGLDLVEVAPMAKPPVCAILSYDKYRYELSQKEKENKKKQKTVEMKEVKFRPVTQTHDLDTKAAAIKRFIDDGKKVLITVQYAKREMLHRDLGYKVVDAILQHKELKDFVAVESPPRMEGSRLTCRITPKKDTETTT